MFVRQDCGDVHADDVPWSYAATSSGTLLLSRPPPSRQLLAPVVGGEASPFSPAVDSLSKLPRSCAASMASTTGNTPLPPPACPMTCLGLLLTIGSGYSK